MTNRKSVSLNTGTWFTSDSVCGLHVCATLLVSQAHAMTSGLYEAIADPEAEVVGLRAGLRGVSLATATLLHQWPWPAGRRSC